jgi:hypothetical protein
MKASTTSHPGEPSASQPTPGQYRKLFQMLSELITWGTPLVDALSVAERGCADTTLSDHIQRLRSRLEPGATLPQAFVEDEAFWGRRTVGVINRLGQQQPARAFRRLAAGAGEHPLRRPLVSCFGMGRLRSTLSVALLLSAVAIMLPTLPYQRQADGLIVVTAFGRHESLMPGLYDTNVEGALDRNAITIHDDPSNLKELTAVLARRTKQPQIATCITASLLKTALLAAELDSASQLSRLAPSPVPAVWLVRKLKLESLIAIKRYVQNSDGFDNYFNDMNRLAKDCPQLQTSQP